MIRKLKSGEFRLYSRKKDASTGKRRNLGTFSSLEKAKQHEREILRAGRVRGHRLIPSMLPRPDSDAKANRCRREVRIAVGWALNSIAA